MGTTAKLAGALRSGKTIESFIRLFGRSPVRHAFKAAVSVWYASEKRARIRSAQDQELSEPEQSKSGQLRILGYARLHATLDSTMLGELEAFATKSCEAVVSGAERQSERRKDFWTYVADTTVTGSELPGDHIMVRFALQEQILRIISRYFGEAPFLNYVLLTHSKHVDAPPKMSQLWHRDYDDTRVVKLFVYLSDVEDLHSGPFTFFPRQASAAIRSPFFLRHLSDDVVFGQVPAVRAVAMTAPKGSAFLVDTGNCYHMGSRLAPGHSRLLYTALYTSVPRYFPGPNTNRISSVPEGLSELQRYALRTKQSGTENI